MYKRLPEIQEPLEELEARLRKERVPELRLRLHLLVLLASGAARSRSQAAVHLALHRNTVARHLDRYEEGGLDALLRLNPGGAPAGQRSVPESAMQALQHGLSTEGFDGYVDVQRWLAQEHQVELPYSTVHGLLRYGLRAKLKRARPSHAKKTFRTLPTSPGS